MAQTCSTCRTENPDGAKFCVECGAPFAIHCPACGHPSSGGRFCAECGAALVAPAAPAEPVVPTAVHKGGTVSERRTTSVLFGDLVSFTTLSEERDPEDVRELLSSYFAVARTVVGRYGGTIEKFIGDAVMAVWGVPVAHEDDAERAVRAGLDLLAEVAALGETVGAPDLSMRVGVVTGSVAVMPGGPNEAMVAGDSVNTAARVQSAADPGTLWTDGETRGLTAAAVAFSDMGEHALKGKAEPVRLFRADAIVAAVGGAQRVDGLEAPLTGRDSEIRRIREAFHATEGDGRSRLVLVEGVAGIGKSRLGWEFEKYADGLLGGISWHRGRCLSYGEGVAFWAFGQMMRSRLGVLDDDDRVTVEAKLQAGVSRYAGDDREAAWLVPRLAPLVAGSGRASSVDRIDLFSAWSTFLERVGGDEPLVLLFEDMQHADDGLLDFVEYLLDSCRAQLFVLVLARPELRDRRPSLGARAALVDLAPLPEPTMAQLVDALVADLPPNALTALVDRAEGIPLYAVETVRSLIDRDAVVARDGRYVFDDRDGRIDLAQLGAPTSLQTLIAARLDALSPEERRTAQDASVLGIAFRRAGLGALSELRAEELDTALAGLVHKGLLETEVDPRSPEVGSHRFLQSLVREVAYGTLARRERRSRHLAAAAHLEREADDTLAGVVAQHLLDALAATPAPDPERSSLLARAGTLLRTAADRALSLGSPEEALRACQSALELEPSPRERAELRGLATRAALDAGRYEQTVELGTLAAADFTELGQEDSYARAVAAHAHALGLTGRMTESRDLLGPAIERVRSSSDVGLLELELEMSRTARALNEAEPNLRATLNAARLGQQVGNPSYLVMSLNSLAGLCVNNGSYEAALALLHRAADLAREHHLVAPLARTLGNLMNVSCVPDVTALLVVAEEAIPVSSRAGNRDWLELTLSNAAYAWWLAGEWDRVSSDAATLLADRGGRPDSTYGVGVGGALAFIHAERREPVDPLPADGVGDPFAALHVGLVNALVLEGAGDLGAAADSAASVFRTWSEAAGELEDFDLFCPVVVDLQLRAGDAPTARSLLELGTGRSASAALGRAHQARSQALVVGAEGGDPEAGLREAEAAFASYGATFYLARTRFELGRWLRSQFRAGEAEPLLEQARRVFVDLGAKRSLEEMSAVLTPA